MKARTLLALIVSSALFPTQSYATSATGVAIQKVIAALKLNRISDLDFGQAEQGAPGKTITPGTADNEENASFMVTGEPFRCYQIYLPGDREVVMSTHGGGTPTQEIPVQQFKSYPSASGNLDANGKQLLLVGASRPAIKQNQAPGLYQGTFVVSVVY